MIFRNSLAWKRKAIFSLTLPGLLGIIVPWKSTFIRLIPP